MERTLRTKVIALFAILVLTFGFAVLSVHAHDGEDHSVEKTEASSADVAQLQKIVSLMQQIIVLLNTLKVVQAQEALQHTPDMHDSDATMEEHHDEHGHEDASTPQAPTLVIEIEPHNNQTHAHVRYVDKPEEMFFVASSIDDEAGIIADIHERTGLAEDVIKTALKYMQ